MTKSELFLTLDALKSEKVEHEPTWDNLRAVLKPRRASSLNDYYDTSKNHNTIASNACKQLASSYFQFITPSSLDWFTVVPPMDDAPEDVKSYCSTVTDITRKFLSESNFNECILEVFQDICSLGTSALYTDFNVRKSRLVFTHIPCGTFAVKDTELGDPCIFARWYSETADNLMKRFGKNGRIHSNKIQKAYDNPSRRFTEKIDLVHLVMPRDKFLPDKSIYQPKQRPYASYYMLEDEKIILEESGYFSFPYTRFRFSKWGTGAYGASPADPVLPDIVAYLEHEEILTELARHAAAPGLLTLIEEASHIDLRPGAINAISEKAAQLGLPREMVSRADYKVGLDILLRKREIIENAFFIDSLRGISEVTHQMTATEVMSRENEKVFSLSPSFNLVNSDFKENFKRIYLLLSDAGEYPELPPGLVVNIDDTHDALVPPGIQLTGRLANFLSRTQAEITINGVTMLAQIAQSIPDVLDCIDTDKAAKDILRTMGVPEKYLRSEDNIKALRDAREAERQQMMNADLAQKEANTAKAGSEAIKSLGGIA